MKGVMDFNLPQKRPHTKQSRQRLYISDLDGTLLRNDATLSNQSRNTLNMLLSKGLLFTVASARSVVTIREVLKGVMFRLPIIEINGAYISEMESGEHLFINDIDPALLPELNECIHEYESVPIIATFDGQRDKLYYNRAHNQGMDKVIKSRKLANDARLSQIDDLRRAFNDKVVCFTVIGLSASLDGLSEEIGKRYNNSIRTHYFKDIYSDYHWLTIQDRKASKDIAIKTIIETNGLEDCEIVVFGDNANDLPMFRIADRAIAVENAIDSMVEFAHEVIGSNQEESVITYIRNDFSTRYRLG